MFFWHFKTFIFLLLFDKRQVFYRQMPLIRESPRIYFSYFKGITRVRALNMISVITLEQDEPIAIVHEFFGFGPKPCLCTLWIVCLALSFESNIPTLSKVPIDFLLIIGPGSVELFQQFLLVHRFLK